MVDYFRALKTIVQSPKSRAHDVRWLEELPQGDYLAAQDIVIGRLEDFVTEDRPLDQAALDALFLIDEHCRSTIEALTMQYVHALALAPEIDDRMWHTVTRYYAALARLYRRFLDRYVEEPSSLPHDLPQLVLNILDCQRCLAKWYYFRHQSIEPGAWMQSHQLYRLAEAEGCTSILLWRHRNLGETTITSIYLQMLMLGTLSSSDMLKHETEIVSGWLADWCGALTLSSDFHPQRHLFYVNLDEDHGGRRARKLETQAALRYWDIDVLEAKLAKAHVDMQQGKTPADIRLPSGARLSDCQPLLEYLLTEWSRAGYQRQRRASARKETNRSTHIIDGLENVCQHIKNITYARRKGRLTATASAPPGQVFSNSVFLQLEGSDEPTVLSAGKWTFTNESKFGYGAVVDAGHNPWLRLGRLIAFSGEQDHRAPVVGVVRNIKHLPDDRRYVGIEVLSRRPTQVTLRNLDQKPSTPRDPSQTDVFLASTLMHAGGFPFSALYLPKDSERNMQPTLLIPTLEFMPNATFELRSEPYVYRVRLGKVIEQRDDWVCVEVRLLEKTSG